MNNSEIRSLYGLKHNPFLPDVPPEALYAIPGTERFAQRVQTMAAQGGFALITGEPGLGKSKTLQQVGRLLPGTRRAVPGQLVAGQSLWRGQVPAYPLAEPLPIHIAATGAAH